MTFDRRHLDVTRSRLDQRIASLTVSEGMLSQGDEEDRPKSHHLLGLPAIFLRSRCYQMTERRDRDRLDELPRRRLREGARWHAGLLSHLGSVPIPPTDLRY